MRNPGTPGLAGPIYTTAEQQPGPCYVLCPRRWRKGERYVLAVLEPLTVYANRRPRSFKQPSPLGTKKVVTWPKDRPLEWRLTNIPTYKPIPAWHIQAQRLRASGMSYRAIAAEVGKDKRAVQNACV